MTLVCMPLVGRMVEEMEADAAAAAAGGGDLVEIRLDFIEGLRPCEHLPRLLRGCPLPALVTYRPNWEGGQYEGDDTTRFERPRLAMELGVDYVDIELKKALNFYDVVFDAVYAPKVTRLLREAEECEVKVVSGVEMFVRQAMGQFEHFTGGIEAPESLMREIAAKYM